MSEKVYDHKRTLKMKDEKLTLFLKNSIDRERDEKN